MALASHLGRMASAMVVSATVLAGVACGESAGPPDGPVTFEVALEDGQRWTAEGPAVERGALCGSGVRHVIRGIEPETAETVPVRMWSGILHDAVTRRNSTEITFVVENTCADGSGSFVTVEKWGPDVWSVDSGTGAYRDLRGTGDLSFTTVAYLPTSPLLLSLDGMLGADAPDAVTRPARPRVG
jgi:hypothetical protein